MRGLAIISGLALMACASPEATVDKSAFSPDYQGIETRLLDGDLVNFVVTIAATRTAVEADAYARCAAAQYTLIRGYSFLRHVRTTTERGDGVIIGDAIYTISPSLPAGSRTIDAEVTVADCGRSGIPTV